MLVSTHSIALAAVLSTSALVDSTAGAQPALETQDLRLEVTSPAFTENGPIPTEFTCDGAKISPPLQWSGVPKGTESIAILAEDPDAPGGTFTHWLVTGLPPTQTSLRAGAALPPGAVSSRNGKGFAGYTGPCPPSGEHRYRFHVYALDTKIQPPQKRTGFLESIQGHVLAEGQLTGTYQRQGR